jgi:hypothetical protein
MDFPVISRLRRSEDRIQIDARRCASQRERIACRDLSLRELRTGPYGLVDFELVRSSLESIESHEYLGAFARSSGALVGCYRLQVDYPVLQHGNLASEFERFCRAGHRIVDVGAYIAQSSRARVRIFEELFSVLIQYMLRSRLDSIYIQVHPERVRTYASMGFEVATSRFRVEGWGAEWVGMSLDVPRLLIEYRSETFRKHWKEKTGRSLDSRLWDRVCLRLRSPREWPRVDGHW